jgi:hypothetical protein
VRRKGIREERVGRARRLISIPGFKIDSRLLAERIVAITGPAFFYTATRESRLDSSGDDSLSVEERLWILNDSERRGLD